MEQEIVLTKEMERVGFKNHDHQQLAKEGEVEKKIITKAANGKRSNGGGISMKNNNNSSNDQKTMLRTPADIFEYPSFYSFVLDMPGLDAQNIKVKVENGILHVTGKKKKNQHQMPSDQSSSSSTTGVVKVIRTERRRARYMRKFTLPADASREDVKATYKDGVLSITVAKNLSLPLGEQSNPTSSPPTNISIN